MKIPRLPDSNPADTPGATAFDDQQDGAPVVTTGQTDFDLPSDPSRRGVPRWAMLAAAAAVVGLIGVNVFGGDAAVVEENETVEEPAEDLRALFTEADTGPDVDADTGSDIAADPDSDDTPDIDGENDTDTAAEADGPPTTDAAQPDAGTDNPPTTEPAQPATDSPPTTDPVADVTPTTDPVSIDAAGSDGPTTTDPTADA